MAPPRFFAQVSDPDALVPLPPDEAHHLRHVLRLPAGAEVGLFDGDGREWRGRVHSADRHGVAIGDLHAVPPTPEPVVHVTLAVALLKGDQMDHVVRDATALGVSAIAPTGTFRVAVPGRAREGGQAVARWRRVAVAAAKQCGRARVPAVAPVAPLAAVLEASRAHLLVVGVEPSSDRAAGRGLMPDRPTEARATVCVGPEGGWTTEELDLCQAAGAVFVHLGPRTLRAELAPVVLLSALWTRWGW